jgi:hypothetical protein
MRKGRRRQPDSANADANKTSVAVGFPAGGLPGGPTFVNRPRQRIPTSR